MTKQGIVLLLISALLITGCATTGTTSAGEPPTAPRNVKEWLNQKSRPKKGAIVGALIGAVAGAAVAGIRGENVLVGAVAGGAAGALVGFLVGKSQDKKYASRDEAVRVAHYDTSQGYVVRVEEVRFDPVRPRPGQNANLYVRYLVIGPDPNENIKVRMFRGLKYGEEYVVGAGPNEFTVTNGGGIVESTIPVTIPAKAPQGTYGLEALLEDPDGRFSQVIGSGSLYLAA